MSYRRATVNETDGSSLQGTVRATYSELVHLFGEPEIAPTAEVLVLWDIQFDDGTIATVYLWKEPSVPAGMHEWNVGGHSPQAVQRVREALRDLPDDFEHVLPPPAQHRAWTKLDRALNRACAAGDVLSVRFFIEIGADVNSRSPEIDGGNVPIEEAIEKGHCAVIEALLAAGADVNARSHDGKVPLHKAAVLADERIVQLLLDSGADTHATDCLGTPADWARRFGRPQIAELIESRQERPTTK